MTNFVSPAIGSKISVPSLPTLVKKILSGIDDPRTCAAEIGAMIESDPALAARVLRIANSSYYGLRERCDHTPRACVVLGLKVVRSIVLHAALVKNYEHLRSTGFDVDAAWRHSGLVARASALLARSSKAGDCPRPDEAFLTGLLHDVGQLVLLDCHGESYAELHGKARADNMPFFLCEQREMGTSHEVVGAMAIQAWGLGEYVRDAVRDHHGRLTAQASTSTRILALADTMVERLEAGNTHGAVEAADDGVRTDLVITRRTVEAVVEAMHEALKVPPSESA